MRALTAGVRVSKGTSSSPRIADHNGWHATPTHVDQYQATGDVLSRPSRASTGRTGRRGGSHRSYLSFLVSGGGVVGVVRARCGRGRARARAHGRSRRRRRGSSP